MPHTANSIKRASLILGLAMLFYFYDNLLQSSIGVMRPELSLAFVKDAESFGSLAAYFTWAYGLMQIPVGLLMDRFGPRRLLTLACLLAALGSLIFGLAETLLQAKCARLFMGLGASFALVGCLKISSLWFQTRRFAFLTGMAVTIGYLGSITSLSIGGTLVEWFTWRTVMIGGGVIGFIILVLLWSIVRDKPPVPVNVVASAEAHHIDLKGLLQGLWHIIQQRQIWIASLHASLMFVPMLVFGLWGVPFLMEAHSFDRTAAGKMMSLIYIGFVLGAPFFGGISDWLGRRSLPMFCGSAVVFMLSLVIIYMPLSKFLLCLALVGLGFFSSSFILAFAVVRESSAAILAGTAIGFINAFNTFGGAAMQRIIGKILDLNAKDMLEDGVRVFSLSEYQTAFLSLPVCLIIAFVLLFFLKETYCNVAPKKQSSNTL